MKKFAVLTSVVWLLMFAAGTGAQGNGGHELPMPPSGIFAYSPLDHFEDVSLPVPCVTPAPPNILPEPLGVILAPKPSPKLPDIFRFMKIPGVPFPPVELQERPKEN